MSVLTFLLVKANSWKSVKKYPFLLFSENADVSTFLTFKANCLEKMRGCPNFSFWIPIALAKVYIFHVVLTWCKNLSI